ncbi:hypothetical protein SEUCBS139899_010551 [Sporothrix eucalyptigena]|uniref:DUF1917 domain-containing protein n=1 Tax=Sporothrix eucalyptigena TaxID=1812306 RepID=A0ABP0D1C2_9PEZI
MNAPRTATSRDTVIARQAAARDVLGLASHLGVTCGKWMLFIRSEQVDGAWEAVARATSRGELGIAAKVSPKDAAADARGESIRDRLICIYTADFRDTADVGRVLRRLEGLGFVQRHSGRAIYYKCGEW